MPSPIAHTAVGYLIYRGCTEARTSGETRPLWRPLGPLLVSFGLSMLPDLDAVVGTVAGDLGRYHNNVTHSLFVGLGAALGLGGLAALCRRLAPALEKRIGFSLKFGKVFLLSLVSYEAHIALDWMTYGKGVMALWPLTERRFSFPITVFYGLRWSEGIWSPHHLLTVLTELGTVGAVVVVGMACARVWRFVGLGQAAKRSRTEARES